MDDNLVVRELPRNTGSHTPIERTKVNLDDIMRRIDWLGAKIDTELKCRARADVIVARCDAIDVHRAPAHVTLCQNSV